MSEIHHECGVAAIYHMEGEAGSLCPEGGPLQVTRLLPRMLQDIQNRGQLAAGMTSYHPERALLLDTMKDVGSVSEVFRLSHRGKSEALMQQYSGCAAIGHVRYATCGQDDKSYAQPFERQHIHKHKWFSFCFNGQLSNYSELREKLARDGEHHLARDTDTEIIMHELGRQLSDGGASQRSLVQIFRDAAASFDGAYSLAFLNARGEMLVARDPLGIKPMCFAVDGPLFAAASESVALLNLGFSRSAIQSLPPGHAIIIDGRSMRIEKYAEPRTPKHCFFEWIYFANVASTLDDRSVYLSRTRLGVELANREREENAVPIDDDTIVVPVPDTSKAAADSMAFQLGIPSREGLIRNRYSGRTFIEGGKGRNQKASSKYTPLREVLEGKRVFLVEDSIVRSTTMKVLLHRIRELGGAKEIHVRVACPPIIAPCFYGIDMSTIGELFAPKFFDGGKITRTAEQNMAAQLGCDSLRYLPIESIARAIDMPTQNLCQACITGNYPTAWGTKLYEIACDNHLKGKVADRTYQPEPSSDQHSTGTTMSLV
jgi:amidophosphoribosyltransferase